MPVSKQVDNTKQLTTFLVEGEVSFDEIAVQIKELYEEDAPTRNVLWDASNGSVANLTTEQIENLASFSPRFSKKREGGKTALYSPGDLAFGLSRVFEIVGNLRNVPIQIKVFRDKDEALKWLETD